MALTAALAVATMTATRTTFAGSFGSHIVLQRAPQRAVVWGFTDLSPGAVTVTTKSAEATALKRPPLAQLPVSLVPAGAAKGDLNPICYQLPNATYADKVHELDPVARRHTEQLNASCAEFGYSAYISNDPVFKDAALFRKASGKVVADTGATTTTVAATIQPYNSTANTWRAVLPPTEAINATGTATPVAYTVSVLKGGAVQATLDDVLFGDVWVCSGQSNMAFLLENDMDGERLVQEANDYPALRFMTTRKLTSASPLRELPCAADDADPGGCTELAWSVSSNVSVSDDGAASSALGAQVGDDDWLYMSAVCYLFGRDLHRSLGVPVGLMNTNWGGTMIEAWLPAAGNAACPPKRGGGGPLVEAAAASGEAPVPAPLRRATATAALGASELYNAMVSPLLNHSIRGAIWYQGEANAAAADLYTCQIQQIVKTWRAGWHDGSGGETDAAFPFGVVQLAAETDTDTFAFTALRWAQTARLGSLPNAKMPSTFLATAYDLGDSASPFGSVHIRWKQDVATRLALSARRVAYADTSVYAGPTWRGGGSGGGGGVSLDVAARTVSLTLDGVGARGLALSPMHLSTKFPQANWSGMPFEVCATGARAARTRAMVPAWREHGSGGGAGGDDVACGYDSGTEGWSAAANATLVASGDSEDAVTLVLQLAAGVDASKVAAVRTHWRVYPCEHLGCGLYSVAERLPPPPFWGWVS